MRTMPADGRDLLDILAYYLEVDRDALEKALERIAKEEPPCKA